MGRSWRLLPRLLGLTLVALSIAVFVIGGLAPSSPPIRSARRAGLLVLSGQILEPSDRRPYLIDPDTGVVHSLSLPARERIEQASCSPWQDEAGQSQVVGRWVRLSGPANGLLGEAFGVVRCTFPGGQVLDRVTSEIQPEGPPCWIPGRLARVVFAGRDGGLYQLAFESTASGGSSLPVPNPERIAWHDAPEDQQPTSLADLAWPTDSRLGGRMFVSLRLTERSARGRKRLGERQLWWLALDARGRRVAASGRLTVPDPFDSLGPRLDERAPMVAKRPDGSLVIAYLVRAVPAHSARWELRVAPLEIDEQTGIPLVRQGLSRSLANDCLPIAPAFSSDTSLLTCVASPGGQLPRLLRLKLSPTPPVEMPAAPLIARAADSSDRTPAGEDWFGSSGPATAYQARVARED